MVKVVTSCPCGFLPHSNNNYCAWVTAVYLDLEWYDRYNIFKRNYLHKVSVRTAAVHTRELGEP